MSKELKLSAPEFTAIAVNPDNRGSHIKFFGKGPAKIALSEEYNISEVFMTVSNKDVVRGLHFQTPGQPKLIQCITGEIQGHILCCNPNSPEFGKVISYTLTSESEEKILVPGDWALGYRAVEDNTRVLYLAGADFVAGGDTGIDPFDPALGLDWGVTKEQAILSEKDLNLPPFQAYVESLKSLKRY